MVDLIFTFKKWVVALSETKLPIPLCHIAKRFLQYDKYNNYFTNLYRPMLSLCKSLLINYNLVLK